LLERLCHHHQDYWKPDDPLQARLGDFFDHFGRRQAEDLFHNRHSCTAIYIQASTDTHYACLLRALARAPPFRYGGIRVPAQDFPKGPQALELFITDTHNTFSAINTLNRLYTTTLKPLQTWDVTKEEACTRLPEAAFEKYAFP
jgi:hypothetical protein